MACFRLLPNYRLEGCRTLQREGRSNPRLHASSLSFKTRLQMDSGGEMIAKDLVAGLGKVRVFSTQYRFGPPCAVQLVTGSDLKGHLTFPNYVDT
jgi:hypothetical protein